MPSCTSPIRVPTAGVGSAEGQLAGGRGLQAHLVLDPGGIDAVALADRAVLASTRYLGTRNIDRPLVPGPCPSGRASTRWKMFSAMSCSALVMNLFTPSMCQVPSGCATARVRPGADVGPGVRLGQRHGGRPPALDGMLGEAPLVRRAHQQQRAGERRAAGVHPDRRVGAQDQLGDRPAERPRRGDAAELGRELQPEPLRVDEGGEGLLEAVRHPHRAGRGIELRRVAVGLGERLGDRAGSQPLDLGQDAARGFLVQLGERLRAHQVLALQHLEQVELDVTEIALVVPHPRPPESSGSRMPSPAHALLVSNLADTTRR